MVNEDFGLLVDRPDRLLRERVTDNVRNAIMRGDLEPGRRLTERELGELTGVSRTSLREALRILQTEGLVEKSGTRGLQVAALDADVVAELYDVRAPLEAAAVELFVRRATDRQVAALRTSLVPRPGGSEDERLDGIRDFYGLLLVAAGNTILRQMFESLEARIHALRRLSLRVDGRAELSQHELLLMIGLIERRDVEGAAAAARAHVKAAKASALTALAAAVE